MADVILDNVTYNQPVADTTALNALPTGALVAGVQCFVNSPPSTYYWSGSAWVLESSGASSLATYLVKTAANAPTNSQVMGVLATGLVKNTTTTGVQTIGVDGTDYYGPATTTINEDDGVHNLFMGNGAPVSSAGSENTSFGYAAATAMVDGTDNTLIGYQAGESITHGSFNTAIGSGALGSITSATRNMAIGQSALGASTTSDSCIAIGPSAMGSSASNRSIGIGDSTLINSTSNDDVAIGYSAFSGINAGSGSNVAIGSMAGAANTEYSGCTFVGFLSDSSANSLTNAGAFGYEATVGISNAINIGAGCLVGISQTTPLAAVHISNVSNSANLLLDTSSSVPGVQASGGQLFVTNPNLFYLSSSGIISPINQGPIVAQVINVDSTVLAASPVTILAANAINNVVITEILIYVNVSVTGGVGPIVIESATGPVTIFSFPLAILTAGAVVDETTATTTSGVGYYQPISNSVIQIAQNAALTTGNINVLIKYQLQ